MSRTLGPRVIEWIEAHLVHGLGDVQGRPVELDDEQVRFILHAYEIDDRGRRVIRRAVFSRPKGRAKSELAAMLVCAEALGPVRFAGWDHAGKPLGGFVRSPYIPCVATEESQADNVYAAVEFMLRHGPLAEVAGLDVGMTRTFVPGGGKIQPITAKAASKEGGRETFAVFDETHLYTTPELRRLHDTIRRNLAKRREAEPWSLEVSTMYAPGEDSVAEHSHRYAAAVASGAVDRSFLFDHREAPADFDWLDDDQLRVALAEAYGAAAEWMDLDRLVAEARDPQTREEDFRRYFLNQPTKRADAWLEPAAWEACADESRKVPDGTEIALAFDGSYNRDSTGLLGCTIEETPHLFVLGAWERPDKAPADWRVPRSEVDAAVDAAMDRFKVREFRCDPFGWHREIEEWGERYGTLVVEYETNRPRVMAANCSKFYSAVVTKALTHDGDARLARHLANAVVKETRGDGAYITKDGRNSPRKIDLAVAAVIAFDAAAELAANAGDLIYDVRKLDLSAAGW